MSDEVLLNPRQRQAVEHGEGPLAVLAGAGTGKTRVLTKRLVKLLADGVPPWEILAVTFTNKAAAEMRERLGILVGAEAATVWVGTFHAVAARLLRRYGAYVGLAPGFLIYDEADQVKVVDRLVRAAKLESRVSARVLVGQIAKAKDDGRDPAEPCGLPGDDVLAQVAPAYQAQLAQENAVDFADLLLRANALTEVEPAASQLLRKFSHVLVDEFQDTNQVQYDLVRRLSRRTSNLTVVGDDDQAIYGWRGARPENLLYFEDEHPGARIVKLEQNYRSTKPVLAAANAVICRNQARHGKTLWTDHKGGDDPVIHQADDDHQEASFVAGEILALLRGGQYHKSDIAVLYRTNQQSRVIEEHLRHHQVASRVVGGLSFYERAEVRDVVAYLRLVANPRADSSLERIINVPPRGIGEATVGKLRSLARSAGCGMLQVAREAGEGRHGVVLPAAARKKLGAFAQLIDGAFAFARGGSSVAQLVIYLIEHSGLKARLERNAEDLKRLNYLADLVASAADFDDRGLGVRAVEGAGGEAAPTVGTPAAPAAPAASEAPAAGEDDVFALRDLEPGLLDEVQPGHGVGRVSQFLERLALAQPEDELAADARDAVELLTIHVAKGLEWPVVFVTGLEEGLFPSLRERDGQDPVVAMEEERRLMYVAVTRARERLYLTHARTRRIYGDVRPCDPSRFLTEVQP